MNDLFLMLSHGALRRVADRWLGPEARSLVNAVLVQGTVASAQPGRELVQVAATIRARSEWSGRSCRPRQSNFRPPRHRAGARRRCRPDQRLSRSMGGPGTP
jgi:hypothetical protein